MLTILFVAPVWYFTRDEAVEAPEKIDSIKLKMGAPERTERLLTVQKDIHETTETESQEAAADEDESPSEENAERSPEGEMDHVEEVQWTDLEEGWNNELKSMLGRLEPADGDEIYKTYMKEQEAYQAELDSLMNEKQQKTSDEAISEIDQLISQLDSKHQDRLKDILGAHYEAVRDQYQQYMESQPEDP